MSANRSDPVLLLTMHVLLLTMHATFPRHGETIDADWKGGQGARLSNGLGCGLSTVGCRLWAVDCGLSTVGTQDVFTLLGVAILSK